MVNFYCVSDKLPTFIQRQYKNKLILKNKLNIIFP